MRNETAITQESLISRIYQVRGQKVMLDKDLAQLYDVKPIRLREQVKRNIEKFPEHFMFRLTEKEADDMVSQNAIPSRQHLGGYLPYVFTEHGVLQLANVLRSERATKMSIRIIEVFIKMREMLLTNKELLLKMEELEMKVAGQDKKIMMVFEYLKQFIKQQEEPRKRIGFNSGEE